MLRHLLVASVAVLGACSEEVPNPDNRVSNPGVTDPRPAPAGEIETRPPKEPDLLLRAMPKDALMSVHLPDLKKAWLKLRGTVFGTLLGSLEIEDLIWQVRPAYEQVRSVPIPPGVPQGVPWEDVERVIRSLNGEVLVSLLDLQGFDRSTPDVRALAGVTVEGAGRQAERLLGMLMGLSGLEKGVTAFKRGNVWELSKRGSPFRFEATVEGEVLLIGIGKGTVAPAVNRLRSGEAEYQLEPTTRSFHADDLARFHIDVTATLRKYRDLIPSGVSKAIEALRLDRVRGVSGALRIQNQDFAVSTFYDSPGGYDLFTRFLSANPVDLDILERIPPRVASFTLFTANPAWLLKNLRIGLPPEQATELNRVLSEWRESGLTLDEEVLSTFGPQCAQIGLFQSEQATSGEKIVIASLANSTWMVQINNEKTVHGLLDRIEEYIPARRRYRVGTAQAQTYSVQMQKMAGFALEPSFAVADGYLYVALTEIALRRVLDRGNKRSAARHLEWLKNIPKKVSSVTYDGMSSPGLLGAAILFGAQRAPNRQMPLLSNLDSFDAALRTLSPAILYTVADESGVYSHTVSPTGGMSGVGGITGIGIISSIAIPNLLKARISANESAAIATLIQLRSAQQQYMADVQSDSDEDERGEYGFMSQLMEPRRGDPLMMPFKGVRGRYMRHGYIFRVFLPGEDGRPIGENGSQDLPIEANLAERHFIATAWPVEKGRTGHRAFIMTNEGGVYFCADGPYGGPSGPPADTICFEPGNMASRTLPDGVLARDGVHWYRVR